MIFGGLGFIDILYYNVGYIIYKYIILCFGYIEIFNYKVKFMIYMYLWKGIYKNIILGYTFF